MSSRQPDQSTQPRRVDAERNRERILEAARAAFAETGADLSMAEIARRSGVGSATLYRNFANRRELLEALYVNEIDSVCRAAEARDGASPGMNLEAWLRRFYAYFTSKGPLAAELLAHSGADDPVFTAGYSRVLEAGRPLWLAAREAGELQVDLSLEQVLDMIVAVAKVPGSPSYREPILQAALQALRRG